MSTPKKHGDPLMKSQNLARDKPTSQTAETLQPIQDQESLVRGVHPKQLGDPEKSPASRAPKQQQKSQ